MSVPIEDPGSVLVLNSTREPHQAVSLQHAIGMMVRGVVTVLDPDPSNDQAEHIGPFVRPRTVVLDTYVKPTWKYGRRKNGKARFQDGFKLTKGRLDDQPAPFCLKNLLIRDVGRCAYCGLYCARTFDHVVPKSRGGLSEWKNALAACEDCNGWKGDRTPEECGLVPLWQPWVPTNADLRWGRTRAS